MPKFTVVMYALASFEVEAETPEKANEIAMTCPISFDMVKEGDCPEVTDYYWSWSDAMGSEVYDENGDTVLCDW